MILWGPARRRRAADAPGRPRAQGCQGRAARRGRRGHGRDDGHAELRGDAARLARPSGHRPQRRRSPRVARAGHDVPEPLKEIRGSQFKPGTARVVVELTRKVGYRIEEGPPGLTVLIDAPAGGPVDGRDLAGAEAAAAPWRICPRMPEAAKPSDCAEGLEPHRKATEPHGSRAEASRRDAGGVDNRSPASRPPARAHAPRPRSAPVVVAQATTTPAPAAPSASAPAAPMGPS